jgi:sulfoxide reductase heme-binding subunit YedZ
MSSSSDPTQHIYWLASRALGTVAMGLVGITVAMGLVMSGRLTRRPGLPGWLKVVHEALSLTALIAIAGHGLLLLGDDYLKPGLAGITVPFAMPIRTFWTGIGVVGGWLAAIIGLSFYVRRWIGVRLWRQLHRWTLLVYALSVGHTLGAGTDAHSAWMIAVLALPAVAILFLLLYRWMPEPAGAPAATAAGDQAATLRLRYASASRPIPSSICSGRTPE